MDGRAALRIEGVTSHSSRFISGCSHGRSSQGERTISLRTATGLSRGIRHTTPTPHHLHVRRAGRVRRRGRLIHMDPFPNQNMECDPTHPLRRDKKLRVGVHNRRTTKGLQGSRAVTKQESRANHRAVPQSSGSRFKPHGIQKWTRDEATTPVAGGKCSDSSDYSVGAIG